jgi:hypothetical protein
LSVGFVDGWRSFRRVDLVAAALLRPAEDQRRTVAPGVDLIKPSGTRFTDKTSFGQV